MPQQIQNFERMSHADLVATLIRERQQHADELEAIGAGGVSAQPVRHHVSLGGQPFREQPPNYNPMPSYARPPAPPPPPKIDVKPTESRFYNHGRRVTADGKPYEDKSSIQKRHYAGVHVWVGDYQKEVVLTEMHIF